MKINRLGEEKLNNKGIKIKIIKYNDCYDIDVEFENGYVRKNLSYTDFKREAIDHVDYSKRIGEIRYNTFGSKITVIDYKDSKNVYAQFDSGYKTITTWSCFNRANLKSPYCKTLYGVGCLGEGEYTTDDIWYDYWRAMIERVTLRNESFLRTYSNATACEEWYNYQNFANWCNGNYYTIEGYKMEIDKDILIKGNKYYSPETCIFVPHIINSLFIKSDKTRGNLPIGVYWHERDNEFRAQCSYVDNNGKRKNKWLGGYGNSYDAFIAYKNFKECHIKEIASRFKNYIPEKLYNALNKYEVEITD